MLGLEVRDNSEGEEGDLFEYLEIICTPPSARRFSRK